MSRLDTITIVIVILCVGALGYLIYKTVGVIGSDDTANNIEEVVEPRETTPEQWPFDDDPVVDSSLIARPEEKPAAVSVPTTPPARVYDLDKGVSGKYMVIAGSFSLQSNAEARVNDLRSKGYANAALGYFNKKSYASAIAGRFDNKTDAQNLVNELKSRHNIDAYVMAER